VSVFNLSSVLYFRACTDVNATVEPNCAADVPLRIYSLSHSARMSKITNDYLTRSGTGCFIAVPIWQQCASKG